MTKVTVYLEEDLLVLQKYYNTRSEDDQVLFYWELPSLLRLATRDLKAHDHFLEMALKFSNCNITIVRSVVGDKDAD